MTASASSPSEPKSPSRRALLAGALGGIGAWAAAAIGRASPVRADGTAIATGGEYTDALTPTGIVNNTNNANVFYAASDLGGIGVSGSSNTNAGVYGSSSSSTGVKGFSSTNLGVYGTSTSGNGVIGDSSSGVGVGGTSNTNVGVYGTSNSNVGVFGASGAIDQAGSQGVSVGNSTGVQGYSGSSLPAPAAKAKTGVYGYAAQDAFARGVTGESTSGIGVYGIATTGYGVYSAGKVYTTKWYEAGETSTPAAPLANRARIFLRDNGSGLTQLCVRFHTGSVKVLATQT
jgi:hypothetical protein